MGTPMVKRRRAGFGSQGLLGYFTLASLLLLVSLAVIAFVGMPLVSMTSMVISQKQPVWITLAWAGTVVAAGGLWWWAWRWTHDRYAASGRRGVFTRR